MIWRLLLLPFFAFSATGAAENCNLQGVLKGDPVYFRTWSRDLWTGSVQVICNNFAIDKHRFRQNATNVIATREVRFESWGPTQGAGTNSLLEFSINNLTQQQAVDFMGTFRLSRDIGSWQLGEAAYVVIETAFGGSVTAKFLALTSATADFSRWLWTGQISIVETSP